MADNRIEYLGSDIRVVVSDEHGFGTDAVLLADFTSLKHKENACDLGTGCGIIPMLWRRNKQGNNIYGIELQEKGYLQACKSAEISSVALNTRFYNADLKSVRELFEHGSMDVVTMNPPYKAPGAGITSSSKSDYIARHETECTLQDITDAASYLLRYNGRLCMCNRPERLSDTITAMKNSSIEPKRLRFVVKNPESRPWLFFIEGRKGGKPFLNVEPMLIMYDDNGNLSSEVIEIYGEYKENHK